jgi:glycosyltransferase involved in cell wall biosynthesis
MQAVKRGRILLVSIGPLFGGAETYLIKLAGLLLHRYDIAAVVNNVVLGKEFERLGISTFDISDRPQRFGGRYAAAMSVLRAARGQFRPDVIHLNGQAEAYLALPMINWEIPITMTRHTPLDNLYLQAGSRIPVWIKRQLVVSSFRRAKHVVCVSELLKRQMARYISAERLSCIPTWLQTDTVAEPRLTGASASPLKLLFVGRILRVKGIFDLIEAVRRVENVSLDVVGEGDDLELARQAAAGLDVTFHGFQSNCDPFYKAADLLVFPSHEGFEGLPQVPLEAMGAGLPTVASNISAVQEIVGDGKRSALFKVGDVEDLAQQLRVFRSDTTRLIELSKAGVERVASRFTKSAVTGSYYQVFDRSIECGTFPTDLNVGTRT